MNRITVMIIDEQPFFRAGVCQVLSQQSEFKIIDYDTTQDTLELIEAQLPDVVLLGSDLATVNGLELGRKISRYYPNSKVIMLSPNPNDVELFEIIRTAAVAYLDKNTNSEELIDTIKNIKVERKKGAVWSIYIDELSPLSLTKFYFSDVEVEGKELYSVIETIDSQIVSRDYMLIDQSDFVCGACVDTCPDVFRMNDDNLAEVYKADGASEEEIEEAMDSCPVTCIHWED